LITPVTWVKSDDPLAVRGIHLVATAPKAASGDIAAYDCGELLPDFLPAGTE
jgi:hypothetical protein